MSKAVKLGISMAEAGEKSALRITEAMTQVVEEEPLAKIDYIKAVNAHSIEPVSEMSGEVLVAMAVYIGKTRLIDNFIFKS